MDRTSLRETHPGLNTPLSPRSQGYARLSSQLPTPETSWSGLEHYEDEDQDEIAECGSRDYDRRHQPAPYNALNESHATAKRLSSRRDSCALRSADSPPYRREESQTLSLPPLKSVLADGISSPPSTPTVYSRSYQPTPQEPSYTSSTYKPPALYPRKKQRTQTLLEPMPWFNQSSSASSPRIFRNPFEKPGATNQVPKDSHPAQSLSLNPYLSSAPRRRSAHERSTSPATADYRRAEPLYNTYYRGENRSDKYREEIYAQEGERRYNDYYEPQPDAQYVLAVRPSYSECDGGSQLRQGDYFHSHTSPNMLSGPCKANQCTLFLPGHGDYHLTKSRKRSNLPKESTDIMKEWFDRNITNPYPTEEEKARFSNRTGISMNQVSNWFINHRRRCPELRDKRERARCKERDEQ